MRRRALLGLASVVLIPFVAEASPLFRITDVGPAAAPQAINAKSQVLVDDGRIGGHDYVWQNGVAKDVSLAPDEVFGMNDKGKVVGYTRDQDLNTTPVYWPKAGKAPHALPILAPVPNGYDRASGVNNAGQVVGWLWDGTDTGPAYWDSSGALTDLSPLVEAHCYTFLNYPKINNKGVIALTSCDHGYKLDAASLVPVQLLGFDTKHAFQCNDCSIAYGINDQNIVVGASRAWFAYKDGSSGIRNEATVWNKSSKPRDIGVLHIDTYPNVNSYAYAVNNAGWVVGITRGSNTQRPFFWTPDGKIQDLNELIDPADPKHGLVTLLSAVTINDKGEIAGVLEDSTLGGEQRNYKLTPSN